MPSCPQTVLLSVGAGALKPKVKAPPSGWADSEPRRRRSGTRLRSAGKDRGPPAVDHQVGAGYVGRLVGGEEEGAPGDLLRRADAAERDGARDRAHGVVGGEQIDR